METAEKLGDDVGLQQACRALGVSRASFYRRRRRKESPTTERQARPSPRALSILQRGHVREVLNSERFMDQAPREVYASPVATSRRVAVLKLPVSPPSLLTATRPLS